MTSKDSKSSPMTMETTSAKPRAKGQPQPQHSPRRPRRGVPSDWQSPHHLSSLYDSTSPAPLDFGGQ